MAEERNQTLFRINAALEAASLPMITKLGLVEEGESEITGIDRIVTWEHGLHADVVFTVERPDGTTTVHTVRMHPVSPADDGMVAVLLLNGQFVFRKWHRVAYQSWKTECPRMFGARMRGNDHAERLRGFLEEELGTAVAQSATILRDIPLSEFHENSGTSAIDVSVRLIEMSVPQEVLDREFTGRKSSLHLMRRDQVRREIGKRLRDAHTLSALLLAFTYLEDNPRL